LIVDWIDKLKRAVERCWQYHGPAINIGWFQTFDLFNPIILFAYPVHQEIVGGSEDGLKVWTGFRFSVSELLKVDGLKVKNIEGASYCVHCNPHPLVDMAGTFEGNDFDLIVLLEPKFDTDVAELRDAATKTVRPIQRGPQT
jgi:hypothetical protein